MSVPEASIESSSLPVVVIGAGPVGLAAAAHLHARGIDALVLEAGPDVGHAVRQWGHVRLFSPWRYLVDTQVRALLERHGWRAPRDDAHPTGAELVRDLLEPVAALPEIAPRLRFGHRVTHVARLGFDRMKTGGRQDAPFLVVAESPDAEVRIEASAVIDASGTWSRPGPLGSSGVPALGESRHADRIRYGIPDARGADRARYAGKRTLVVGGGHSAFNAVLDLAALAGEVAGTAQEAANAQRADAARADVVWAVRRSEPGQMFGGGDADALSERGALGRRAEALIATGGVEFVTGFRVSAVEERGPSLVVTAEDGRELLVDEIVAATGFRPDLDFTRELRLELDQITEAPVRLAPLIDPNVHSCGSVPPHGEAELAHPERGFYAVGMKSYGRAPTFLLLTGYEQVRSVVAHLAGDFESARRVELELPETGVCSTNSSEEACQRPVAAQGVGSESAERGPEDLEVLVGAGGCC